MADDDDHDRRRAERIPIYTEFAAMPSATYISDLSEYGVFVHTQQPAPMGTKLKLRFTVLLEARSSDRASRLAEACADRFGRPSELQLGPG